MVSAFLKETTMHKQPIASVIWVGLALSMGACTDKTEGSDDCTADADGDGLSDCDEDSWGTDPDVTDSDGDGLSDGDEVSEYGSDPLEVDSDGDGFDDGDEADCGSDPADGDEVCYACGWQHNDPGTLETTGSEEGDVIQNLQFVDQCEEEVSLWDLSGEWHIIYMTAAW